LCTPTWTPVSPRRSQLGRGGSRWRPRSRPRSGQEPKGARVVPGGKCQKTGSRPRSGQEPKGGAREAGARKRGRGPGAARSRGGARGSRPRSGQEPVQARSHGGARGTRSTGPEPVQAPVHRPGGLPRLTGGAGLPYPLLPIGKMISENIYEKISVQPMQMSQLHPLATSRQLWQPPAPSARTPLQVCNRDICTHSHPPAPEQFLRINLPFGTSG